MEEITIFPNVNRDYYYAVNKQIYLEDRIIELEAILEMQKQEIEQLKYEKENFENKTGAR